MNQRTPMKQSAHTNTGTLCRLALLLALAVGAVMGLALQASADPPRYRIIVIDPPDGVEPDAVGGSTMGINNRGEVVGAYLEGFSYSPLVWLPARNANYNDSAGLAPGTHALPVERPGFVANKINVNGFVVGKGVPSNGGTSSWLWNLNLALPDCGSLIESLSCSDCGTLHQHKEEALDINDDNPPVIVGSAWIQYSPFEQRGFRMALGQAAEELDPILSINVWTARAVSNTGFVVGNGTHSENGIEECGQPQDVLRAVAWDGGTILAENLSTLGTSIAETFTVPEGVNNASPEMIVGWGEDPNDLTLPCRHRALFWENAMAEPMALPFLTVNGQPLTEDAMQANAIADVFAGGTIEAVGHSSGLQAGVLWRRVSNAWEAIDLNTIAPCGGAEWTNVSHAYDINACGWIAGRGMLTDGTPRIFVLIPVDACPGDITGSEVTYPDGKVNVNDLLGVIAKWATSDCVADITGDSTVNVSDLLAVINGWGTCACFPAQAAVESLSQELTNAGLTLGNWNEYLEVAVNGTQSQKELYNCWMQRLMSGCTSCPSCSGRNPFGN